MNFDLRNLLTKGKPHLTPLRNGRVTTLFIAVGILAQFLSSALMAQSTYKISTPYEVRKNGVPVPNAAIKKNEAGWQVTIGNESYPITRLSDAEIRRLEVLFQKPVGVAVMSHDGPLGVFTGAIFDKLIFEVTPPPPPPDKGTPLASRPSPSELPPVGVFVEATPVTRPILGSSLVRTTAVFRLDEVREAFPQDHPHRALIHEGRVIPVQWIKNIYRTLDGNKESFARVIHEGEGGAHTLLEVPQASLVSIESEASNLLPKKAANDLVTVFQVQSITGQTPEARLESAKAVEDSSLPNQKNINRARGDEATKQQTNETIIQALMGTLEDYKEGETIIYFPNDRIGFQKTFSQQALDNTPLTIAEMEAAFLFLAKLKEPEQEGSLSSEELNEKTNEVQSHRTIISRLLKDNFSERKERTPPPEFEAYQDRLIYHLRDPLTRDAASEILREYPPTSAFAILELFELFRWSDTSLKGIAYRILTESFKKRSSQFPSHPLFTNIEAYLFSVIKDSTGLSLEEAPNRFGYRDFPRYKVKIPAVNLLRNLGPSESLLVNVAGLLTFPLKEVSQPALELLERSENWTPNVFRAVFEAWMQNPQMTGVIVSNLLLQRTHHINEDLLNQMTALQSEQGGTDAAIKEVIKVILKERRDAARDSKGIVFFVNSCTGQNPEAGPGT